MIGSLILRLFGRLGSVFYIRIVKNLEIHVDCKATFKMWTNLIPNKTFELFDIPNNKRISCSNIIDQFN